MCPFSPRWELGKKEEVRVWGGAAASIPGKDYAGARLLLVGLEVLVEDFHRLGGAAVFLDKRKRQNAIK